MIFDFEKINFMNLTDRLELVMGKASPRCGLERTGRNRLWWEPVPATSWSGLAGTGYGGGASLGLERT